MQNKIYYNSVMINMYFKYVLEYFIDARWHELDNYNYSLQALLLY